MTPKEYLQQYRDAVRRATAAQDHLAELRAMAERITPRYDSEPTGTHGAGDKLGAAVARIVDAETVVDAEISLLIATAREVENTIKGVKDSTLRALLYERYINGKTFEQIAVQLNYSWRQTCRLHGAALAEIGKMIGQGGEKWNS